MKAAAAPSGTKKPKRGAPIVERFWFHVDKTESCWLWRLRLNSDGYGRIQTSKGRYTLAHRFAYEIEHGPIPAGLVIRHTCDTPACVRHDHMLLGTRRDNNADKVERNRQARGEAIANHRLTEFDVVEIRRRAALGHGSRRLSREFRVSRSCIDGVLRRRTWWWL